MATPGAGKAGRQTSCTCLDAGRTLPSRLAAQRTFHVKDNDHVMQTPQKLPMREALRLSQHEALHELLGLLCTEHVKRKTFGASSARYRRRGQLTASAGCPGCVGSAADMSRETIGWVWLALQRMCASVGGAEVPLHFTTLTHCKVHVTLNIPAPAGKPDGGC